MDLVLTGHEPFPALAVSRRWTWFHKSGGASAARRDSAELVAPPSQRPAVEPAPRWPCAANRESTEWRWRPLERLRHRVRRHGRPGAVGIAQRASRISRKRSGRCRARGREFVFCGSASARCRNGHSQLSVRRRLLERRWMRLSRRSLWVSLFLPTRRPLTLSAPDRESRLDGLPLQKQQESDPPRWPRRSPSTTRSSPDFRRIPDTAPRRPAYVQTSLRSTARAIAPETDSRYVPIPRWVGVRPLRGSGPSLTFTRTSG